MVGLQDRHPERTHGDAHRPRRLSGFYVNVANDLGLLSPHAGWSGAGLLFALATSLLLWALIALGLQQVFGA